VSENASFQITEQLRACQTIQKPSLFPNALRKFGVLLALGLLVVGRTEVVLLAGAVHRDALPSTERPMPQGHSTRIDEQRAGFSAQLVYQALDVNTS
jgi:hypothetical protein